ncbi:MAG: hypothetical protein ACRD1R_17860 [Acidobacteriota bacterium]
MRSPLLLLNIAILAVLVVLGQSIVSAWQEFEEQSVLPQRAATGESSTENANVETPTLEQPRPFADFLVVAERNLFSPERRPEAEGAGEQEQAEAPKPPPLPVKPALSGISTIQGEKTAFITVYRGNKTQGESRAVKVGALVEGYRVSQIGDSTLVLKWNDYAIEISREEAPAPQGGNAQAAIPVTIIKVGSAAAAVETISSAEGRDEEERGLEVGVVGAQPAQGLSNRGGLSGGQRGGFPGAAGGRGGLNQGQGNRGLRGGQDLGGLNSGTVGFPNPAPRRPPNQ